MFQILPLITKNRFWGLHIGKEFTHFFSHQEPADKKKTHDSPVSTLYYTCFTHTLWVG